MKIRKRVFDTYWYFAAERQAIFFKRLADKPKPWTNDPILATYKLCNTYRASDRVSQYLIRHVIYTGSMKPEDILLRIVLFKLFNKIDTWQYLVAHMGEITYQNFDTLKIATLLEKWRAQGGVIYHNAYMSCATKAFGYEKKHQNHLALVEQMMMKDLLGKKIAQCKTFADLFALLRVYPLIGDFMAYQLATDINYSELTDFSETEFTVVGPGSKRGIEKCFEDRAGKSYEYIIQWMQEHQVEEFERLGINFQSLWGRPLQLIDCQGLFCETDKYARAAFPELKSNRKKIKAEFKMHTQPIAYFYPPKWGINEKIALNV